MTYTINGLSYNVEESGSGARQALLLHYFGGAGASWRGVMQLVPDLRCAAPDLAGFGASSAAAEPYTVDQHAADMVALVETLGFDDWALVGHSMGGKIAMALAALRPVGLRELILVAPSPPTPEPMTDADRKRLRKAWGNQKALEQQIATVAVNQLPTNLFEQALAEHGQVSEAAWQAWVDQGSNENISAQLGQITVPVTIIGGEQDPVASPGLIASEVTPYLTATSAKVSILPGCGHLLPFERPHAIAAALTDAR